MSLAQELATRRQLNTGRINRAFHNHDVAEIAQLIGTSENCVELELVDPPVNGEVARHFSDAVVQNSHIRKLTFMSPNISSPIRNLVAWIGSRNTLVNMTSLESVVVYPVHNMSVLDCSTLFPLLLTSTSLQSFTIDFQDDRCSDDVMSALSSYLGAASFVRFDFCSKSLSEAAFIALCDGVASSTVRQFTLRSNLLPGINAESLARAIVESSLEEITIEGGWPICRQNMTSALTLTAPVRNMDFAFTQIGDDTYETHLSINRKWKPLIFGANTPLALWPHILEKSHVFPETSHGSVDIIFYVLTQKPDLVPAP